MLKGRYTPQLVVENDLMFSIPLYQRIFAWGEEQVKALMRDLEEHFLNKDTTVAEKPYYLGQLTVIHQEDGKYTLIDGQQRCTVMTLLAIALLRKGLNEENKKNWQEFLKNGKRLHFKGRKQDNEFIEKACSSSDDSKLSPKMAEAIAIMVEEMPECMDVFASMIYQNLSFFFAELDQSYIKEPSSLNKYFETMNSSGKGLEQHEILKVELIRNQSNQDYLTRIWNVVSCMNKQLVSKEDNHKEKNIYEELIELCRAKKHNDVLKN